MAHPAYVDYYCEKHEKWHQEDICPLCYHEDEPEICEDHGIEQIDGFCEICEAEYAADEQRARIKDERP